jgi:hypothetical protein
LLPANSRRFAYPVSPSAFGRRRGGPGCGISPELLFATHQSIRDSKPPARTFSGFSPPFQHFRPPAPSGEIYATESFAALAAAEAWIASTFEYAGQIRLPKNYGTIPVYHVTPCG